MNRVARLLRRNPGEVAGIALALLVFVVTAWPAAGLHSPALVASLADDAFYYYVVAHHVTAGDGFTFDGIHPTNGFQPLWLFLLLPLFALVRDGDARLVAAILLQAACFAASAWLIGGILRRRLGTTPAALVVLAFFALPGARSLWLGLESGIVLLTLALAWRAWLAFEEADPADAGRALRFGVAGGLLSLARLEGLVGVLAVLAFDLLRAPRDAARRPARVWVALVAPVALLVGGYLLWSLWLFGTPLPVSGQVKAYWVSRMTFVQRATSLLDLEWPGRHVVAFLSGTAMPPLAARLVPTALLALALGAAWVARQRVGATVRAAGIAFPLVAGAAITLADHVVVGRFLGEWAAVPVHLITALGAGLILARAGRLVPVAIAALLVVNLLRVPYETRLQRNPAGRFNAQVYEVALRIREALPRDAVIQGPFSGVLAWYSGRRVVNLDGLVNSPAYLREVVRGGRWEAWVRRERPEALVDVDCGPETSPMGLAMVLGRLPRGEGCLTHDPRVPPVPMGAGCLISTWRFDPDACDPGEPTAARARFK